LLFRVLLFLNFFYTFLNSRLFYVPMKTEWKIFWIYLIVIALITKPYVYGENEASRFNALAAIVEEHSLGWTSRYFVTDDRIYINGKEYSDKPYALVLLAAPFYWVLYSFGIGFENSLGWSTYLLKVFVVGIPTAFLLVIFYRSLLLEKKYKTILTLILGFCTLLFTYATTFNNHNISALFLFVAFLLHTKKDKANLFFLGVFLGLGTALDVVIGIFFTIGFFSYYFFFAKTAFSEKAKLFFGFFLLFLLYMIPNYLIISNVFIPAYAHPEYYIAARTWQNQENLPGFYNHRSPGDLLLYTFHSTFGFRGFFSYSPVLFFGFCILLWKVWKKRDVSLLPLIFAIIATISYYCVYTINYGGSSYGSRYFIPLIPILIYFCADIFTTLQKYKTLFYVLALISFLTALVGAFNPWANHANEGMYAISFVVNFAHQYVYNTAGHYVLHALLPWWF